jgi:hypothetical protein
MVTSISLSIIVLPTINGEVRSLGHSGRAGANRSIDPVRVVDLLFLALSGTVLHLPAPVVLRLFITWHLKGSYPLPTTIFVVSFYLSTIIVLAHERVGYSRKFLLKMVFLPSMSAPILPEIPDDIPICDFMLDERYGRYSLVNSLDPFTCGVSGKSYSALEVVDRVQFLTRSLAKEFDWQPNIGAEWDKVVCIFSFNVVCDNPIEYFQSSTIDRCLNNRLMLYL